MPNQMLTKPEGLEVQNDALNEEENMKLKEKYYFFILDSGLQQTGASRRRRHAFGANNTRIYFLSEKMKINRIFTPEAAGCSWRANFENN